MSLRNQNRVPLSLNAKREGETQGTTGRRLSTDEVVALLNERVKAECHDTKGKIEQLTDCIKRLKVGVNWYQQIQTHVQEKEDLGSERCTYRKLDARAKVEELQTMISKLE